MKKTKLTLKSIVDGILSYWVYYFWTAFLIWIGLNLFKMFVLNYWQCLGFTIVLRQLIGIIVNRTDLHIKKENVLENTGAQAGNCT